MLTHLCRVSWFRSDHLRTDNAEYPESFLMVTTLEIISKVCDMVVRDLRLKGRKDCSLNAYFGMKNYP